VLLEVQFLRAGKVWCIFYVGSLFDVESLYLVEKMLESLSVSVKMRIPKVPKFLDGKL